MEQESQLDIKGILEKISYFFNEVLRKKWWLALGGILVGLIMGYMAWKQPRYYPAPITFFLNNSSSSLMPGGIASLLGAPLGGGDDNFAKIKVIAKSQNIVARSLNTSVTYDGKEDFLGNFVLEAYEEELDLDTPLSMIQYGDTTVHNTLNYNRLSKKLHSKMVGSEKNKIEGLFEFENDDETGLMTLSGLAKKPELSILIAETHFKTLSKYYIDNKVSAQQKSYDKVSKTTDSLYSVLRGTEYQLAKASDYSRGLILNKDKLSNAQLQRKLEMLYKMYGEALANKETAKFMLDKETPHFNVLDMPVEPIWQKKGKPLFQAILGFVIGLFIATGVIVGRRWFLDELK